MEVCREWSWYHHQPPHAEDVQSWHVHANEAVHRALRHPALGRAICRRRDAVHDLPAEGWMKSPRLTHVVDLSQVAYHIRNFRKAMLRYCSCDIVHVPVAPTVVRVMHVGKGKTVFRAPRAHLKHGANEIRNFLAGSIDSTIRVDSGFGVRCEVIRRRLLGFKRDKRLSEGSYLPFLGGRGNPRPAVRGGVFVYLGITSHAITFIVVEKES